MRRATHTFANDPTEVGRARRVLGANLGSWGAPVDPNILLAVSELMTNAVRHGRGVVQLTVAYDEQRLRIEVHDEGGATVPEFRDPQTGGVDIGGFGLHLVDAIADDWGIEHNGGTRVWFEAALGTTGGNGASRLPRFGLSPPVPGDHGAAPASGLERFDIGRLSGPAPRPTIDEG